MKAGTSGSSRDYYPLYGTQNMVPVFTKYCQESHSEEGAKDVEAALHHGRDKLGQGGHAHQDDGHEGQNHVDAFPQQHLGVHGIRLQGLLLLLMQFQLRDARLASFQGFLQARGQQGIKYRWNRRPCGNTCPDVLEAPAHNT